MGIEGFFSGFILIVLNFCEVAEKITLAKKCRHDTMILLFTLAITSAFAECWRELERLSDTPFFGQEVLLSTIWLWLSSLKQWLKLVSAIFYRIFIFSPNDSPSKTEMFFISSKSSFCSGGIQSFVAFPLPFHLFQIQKDKGSGIINDVMHWLA